jgi:hypothetical protein
MTSRACWPAISTHDRDVESNAPLDALSDSLARFGYPSDVSMHFLEGFGAEPLTGCAAKMSYRNDDDADPRFFFLLIGLALLMVWLTQQLYL